MLRLVFEEWENQTVAMRLLTTLIHVALILSVAGAVLVGAGCRTAPPPSDTWPEPAEPAVLLQSGDVLDVKFTYWPELNLEQPVRPDGHIEMQLVGSVKAEGLTPEQLRAELVSRYAPKIKDPEITVIVRSLSSHRVYVGGEVRTPGIVPMTGPMTVLEALMHAGGYLKESAKLKDVVVLRQREDQQFARTVDVRGMLQNPESDAFYLEPFDVVYVPPTNIDQVDQFVDQYINKIIPRNVHSSFGVSRLKVDRDDTSASPSPLSLTLDPTAK